MATGQDAARSFNGLPTASGNNGPRQLASKPANIVDLTTLQNASHVLHDQFLKDSQIIPDLGDTLSARVL